MEIIFVTDLRRNRRRVHLGQGMARVAIVAGIVALVGSFWLGLQFTSHEPDVTPDIYAAAWEHEVRKQRAEVDRAIELAGYDVDALASKLGELHARALRLDALGGRLVDMAELDGEEFGFDEAPALGGLPAVEGNSFTVPDFLAQLRGLSARLEDRTPKLEAIESTLMSAKLLDEISPSGSPVLKGWMSSPFGWRADPVSGRKNFHEGVDFPGKRGSAVVAVASGVVRWAGRRSGYGKVVEINHGKGLLTRYAHNSKNLVTVGSKIKKGQTIAKMGATGYVTGVHVHFEVLKDGKPINPLDFIKSKRN